MRSAILLLALVAVTVQAVVLQQPTHSLLETMTASRHNNFVKLITLANMTDKFDGSDREFKLTLIQASFVIIFLSSWFFTSW